MSNRYPGLPPVRVSGAEDVRKSWRNEPGLGRLFLWGFGFVADAGTSAAVSAGCPPTRFVAVAVRGVPVLRAALMADNEHRSIADENGRDIG